MKKNTISITLFAVLTLVSMYANAIEDIRTGKKERKSTFKTEANDCVSPKAQFDLDINNVRARLLTGGDLWWNLSDARYQVPKGDVTARSLNALFAGAIWITGVDAGNVLKCAAQRYRASGDDYWPGPITNGVVDKATCSKYDVHFNVFGADIDKAQAAFALKGASTTVADIPTGVLAWPAKGNPYLSTDPTLIGETYNITDNLAPFKDYDKDGEYDPTKGDFPIITCRGQESEAYADQMIFWVMNDIGNQHTETNGISIGIQVNALAFAFQTTDDINNMTFYKYEIINKSSSDLFQTYIAQWADPDLGCYTNDRVGCDVSRSLGIIYNDGSNDPDCGAGVAGYGTQLPIFGIDFFEGPLGDDTLATQLGLTSFSYFTNGGIGFGDPESAVQYRNFHLCKWSDGTPLTDGGTGYNQGGNPTCFLFPGNPIDPLSNNDITSGQAAGDRRMVQTSGPFTLKTGAPQYITVGCVFVRPEGGVGSPPDFNTSIAPADEKAQELFNRCFQLLDGPDAPTLSIRELDKKIIINLQNIGGNNVGESYNDALGPAVTYVKTIDPNADSTYTFEGYKVYQVSGPTVSATDLEDVTKAILFAQVDVKNNITEIINYAASEKVLGLIVPVLKTKKVNTGITNSFVVDQDLFTATDNKQLVNHKAYYFTAIAYAHNDFLAYNQNAPNGNAQLLPYLQGRKNFNVYSAIPHIPNPRNEGTIVASAWGDGVEVKRVEGQGNGGNVLDLTQETIAKILASSNGFADTLSYVKKADPIGFKITDPIALKEADFELRFVELASNNIGASTGWYLHDLTNNDTVFSERGLDRPYEQQIFLTKGNERVEYGFSIRLGTPLAVDTIPRGYLAPAATSPLRLIYNKSELSSIAFQNPTEQWLSFVKDEGITTASNWIRSGSVDHNDALSASPVSRASAGSFDDNWWYTQVSPPSYPHNSLLVGNADADGLALSNFTDPDEIFENILGGTWAPYCLTANYSSKSPSATAPNYVFGPGFRWRNYGIAYGQQVPPQNTLDRLASVNIVITPDQSKWSRCVVLETGETELENEGAEFSPNGIAPRKGQIRMALSKDLINGQLQTVQGDTGRSWFPGYAVNIETGERLNIAFGETSDQGDQNGKDMLWNPTDKFYSGITYPGQLMEDIPIFGGKHFIYVMETKYDGGEAAQDSLLYYYNMRSSANTGTPYEEIHKFYRSLMWTTIPYMTPGYTLVNGYIPPAEVTIKLRVEKPYERLQTNATGFDPLPRYQFSTKGLGASEKNTEISKSALDIIRIVPNPYMAFSAYETDQNSNRVKVTNLPNKCTITIFALDGTLIRKLTRAIDIDPSTNRRIDISDGANIAQNINLDNTVDWDLKNDRGIPIASGVYIFHIDAPGIGQKTLKWFGTVRPADTSNF